jgi:perosamine synthetase
MPLSRSAPISATRRELRRHHTFSFHGTDRDNGEAACWSPTGPTFTIDALFRDHSRAGGLPLFEVNEVAYKYKMSSLQAAFGLAQLERLDELIARKRDIFSWYRQRLEDVPGLTLNVEPPGMRHAYWMVTMIVDRSYGLNNRQMMEHFDRREAILVRFPP